MMKNLRPVERDCARSIARLREDLSQCLTSLEQGRVLPLLEDVDGRYCKYFENMMELELLNNGPSLRATTSREIAPLLKKVYRKVRAALRQSIVSAQSSDFARDICQYCGIVPAPTLDHYVPKADFPEFYVLPINLLPSCRECNGPRPWLTDEGKRRVINFYVDSIPGEDECLEAQITISKDRPRIEYDVVTKGADSRFVALYEAHFGTLGLKARYESQASPALQDEVSWLITEGSPEQSMRRLYMRRAETKRANRGVNDWEAAFYQALSESEEFWRWIAPRRRAES